LVCCANQHIASRLLGVSPTIGAAPRNVIGRMDRAARSPASQGGCEGVDLCPQPNPTSDDLPRDCPRAAAPAIARNQERIAQPGAFCRGVREGSVLAYSTRAATTARRAPENHFRLLGAQPNDWRKKTSPSGETNTTSRLPGEQPGDWRKPSRPESGAISHSRACFAEESARGVYLRTRPERRRPQGALRHSDIAPCTKKEAVV